MAVAPEIRELSCKMREAANCNLVVEKKTNKKMERENRAKSSNLIWLSFYRKSTSKGLQERHKQEEHSRKKQKNRRGKAERRRILISSYDGSICMMK